MWRRLTDRLNHEYWPWQLVYLPVVPLYLYQAIRQRRAAFFTNVNPAIDMGGFFGESKLEIYKLLPKESYPQTVCVPAGSLAYDVRELLHRSGMTFPLIVKPDTGERGDGVKRISDEEELIRALSQQPVPLLMQALAQGEHECGLMFARDMGTGRAELLSVTGKRFLSVAGDGRHSVEQLLSLSWRGRKQVERLRSLNGGELLRIPAKGERVVVEPIGNHCRGTVFFDACDLSTPALRDSLDALLKDARGINYGRLDVRSESEQALREGRFTIVELNGVSSEPGHIYDPSYNIFRCWWELVRHVRHVGRISRYEQQRGHKPVTLGELLTRCEHYFGWRSEPVRRLAAVFA